MLHLFQKKNQKSKHIHRFTKSLGKYYKLYRTEYRNNFDRIVIYERKQCECGYYEDSIVSRDDFLPSMFHNDWDEKEFIKKIKSQGIEEEFEINLRTGIYSNRTSCCR